MFLEDRREFPKILSLKKPERCANFPCRAPRAASDSLYCAQHREEVYRRGVALDRDARGGDVRARRATTYVERFRPEQKAWIARARTAPSVYKAAATEARDIVSRLQAKQRRTGNNNV